MIYIFTGENDFALKQEVDKKINTFVSNHGDLALERFDGEEIASADIIDAASSIPMFAQQKLVLVQGASKDLLELAAKAQIPKQTDLIIIVPKIDRRAAYYKKIQKLPGFKSFSAQSPHSLPRWVVEQAKAEDGIISLNDARYLVERVGPNQMKLASEVEKLLIYNNAITRQTIDLLTEPSPQTTTFELLEAALAGNQKRAQQIYQDQRALKVDPIKIIGLIAWQLHVLAVLKTAAGRSIDEIATESKLKPYSLSKSQTVARRLSLAQIKKYTADLMSLDESIKTINIDIDEALELYLIKLGNPNL